jgi:hypothetical protein
MVIGIISTNYLRPRIFHLWCASIKRLREETGLFIPCVVVSEPEDEETCKRYNITHITQQNNPVSNKFNTACEFMKEVADYCMILGSDDIISTDTFLRIKAEAEKGYDLIGVDQIYFFSTDTSTKGQMVLLHRPGKMLGVGKTISSKVLDQVGWRPWNREKNWGLDGIAQECIRPFVQTTKIVEGAEIADCKSKQFSMNKASFWFGKIRELQDTAKFYSFLGEEEKQILKQILCQ